MGSASRLGTPHPAGVGGIGGVGADALGERGQQPGEQGVRRRVEPEGGRARGEEVEVLGTPDRATAHRLDIDQARFAEPLEVEADGVRVEREPLGEILRGQRRGRAGELRYMAKRVSSPSAFRTVSWSG